MTERVPVRRSGPVLIEPKLVSALTRVGNFLTMGYLSLGFRKTARVYAEVEGCGYVCHNVRIWRCFWSGSRFYWLPGEVSRTVNERSEG
jgi:hypothetical protein